MSKSNPFDWMKSISETKENLLDVHEKNEYNPFIVNKGLSYYIDCLLFSNEMNIRNTLDKDMQYTFLLNGVRKGKRYSPWEKKFIDEDIKYIKKYYSYNNEKALQALKILTKSQIEYIKNKLENFELE